MNFPFSILILLEIFTASKADGCWMCEKKDALSFIDSCVFLGAVSLRYFWMHKRPEMQRQEYTELDFSC